MMAGASMHRLLLSLAKTLGSFHLPSLRPSLDSARDVEFEFAEPATKAGGGEH